MKSIIEFENEKVLVNAPEDVEIISNLLKALSNRTLNDFESENFDKGYNYITLFYEKQAMNCFPKLKSIGQGTIHLWFEKHNEENVQDYCKIIIN